MGGRIAVEKSVLIRVDLPRPDSPGGEEERWGQSSGTEGANADDDGWAGVCWRCEQGWRRERDAPTTMAVNEKPLRTLHPGDGKSSEGWAREGGKAEWPAREARRHGARDGRGATRSAEPRAVASDGRRHGEARTGTQDVGEERRGSSREGGGSGAERGREGRCRARGCERNKVGRGRGGKARKGRQLYGQPSSLPHKPSLNGRPRSKPAGLARRSTSTRRALGLGASAAKVIAAARALPLPRKHAAAADGARALPLAPRADGRGGQTHLFLWTWLGRFEKPTKPPSLRRGTAGTAATTGAGAARGVGEAGEGDAGEADEAAPLDSAAGSAWPLVWLSTGEVGAGSSYCWEESAIVEKEEGKGEGSADELGVGGLNGGLAG